MTLEIEIRQALFVAVLIGCDSTGIEAPATPALLNGSGGHICDDEPDPGSRLGCYQEAWDDIWSQSHDDDSDECARLARNIDDQFRACVLLLDLAGDTCGQYGGTSRECQSALDGVDDCVDAGQQMQDEYERLCT
ncbi:MAG: hypothetical protein KTR31_32040 [Myxococcales bacterium]|nr:hypothetical protein [Myxococcales bacterium]